MEALSSSYLIDLLGLAQGVILGLVLIVANKKGRPTLLLGLFLLTYTVEILPSLLSDVGLSEQYFALVWLPLRFYFLSMPLLFLYVLQLTGQLDWEQHWKHLTLGVIEFFTLGAFFLLEAGGANRLFSVELAKTFMSIYFLVGLILNLVYAWLILVRLRTHRKNLLEVHSNLKGKWLGWLSVGIYLLIAFIFILILLEFGVFLLDDQVESLLVSSINVFLIYYLAVNGIRQLSFKMPEMSNEQNKVELTTSLGNSTKVQGTDEGAGREEGPTENPIFLKLLSLMETDRPYLEDQLTITDLARQMAMSERSLSRLINRESGSHFNAFINGYRVEEAKTLLSNREMDHLTMEGIALEAGFFSRATFYAAFKKETNESPTSFKKRLEARV